jgi:hypothetical protein
MILEKPHPFCWIIPFFATENEAIFRDDPPVRETMVIT